MDLDKQTKALCQQYKIKPVRSRGQNFLIREEIYDKIIAAADLKKDDIVLEVGPGLGFLTEKLAKKVKKVIAVELDDRLSDVLRGRLEEMEIGNVEVVNEDVLKFSIFNFQFSNNFKIQNSKFKIVANLPYQITSRFLRNFLGESEIKPSLTVLMLQKEVAERITAKPGKMSLLAVSAQYYADVKIIDYVGKENFWPKPAVDSAVLRLDTKKTNRYEINEREFFRLVRVGFSARRKMLKNNLAGGYSITGQEASKKVKTAGLSEKIRAQELSVLDWVKLFGFF